MTSKAVNGLYAALLTPRTQEGEFNPDGLRSEIRFLQQHGIDQFAVNGATGEFPLTSFEEFQQILDTTARTLNGRGSFVAGVGSTSTHGTVRLGRMAFEFGATALLLPMPWFFKYGQEDLEAFCLAVAAGPILLYNLPQFASGLAPQTTLRLLTGAPNIVGIKDSSGSLDTLRLLSAQKPEACRIVGNDSVLSAALRERLCDGVISGVACVLPELLRLLYGDGIANPSSDACCRSEALLGDFIVHIENLPTPWGLKIAAEARHLGAAHFLQPLAARRAEQRQKLRTWLAQWLPSAIVN